MSLELKLRPAKILKLEIWPTSTNYLPTSGLYNEVTIAKKLRKNMLKEKNFNKRDLL